MAERMLITKLVRTEQTRADLYARGHQWPDLKLFDLADLHDVGIEPNDLQIGQEVPCRFWAIYELSEKLNKAGNPYKDVIALERMDEPATATSTDTSALLDELRAIRGLLETIVKAQTPDAPAAPATPQPADEEGASSGEPGVPVTNYGDGTMVSGNVHELDAFDEYLKVKGHAPENVTVLRQWVQTQQDSSG